PCHFLLYCSRILRLKRLYVTAEGTRRAHVPAASGLGFCPPGCEPKPVRFFNRPSGCRSHLPRLQREIAVHDSHPSRIWLGFSPSRVRTKTCPLFSPATRRHPIWS